nr:MAG TPA: minor capsid protein [Caudoviricetes sp.]
MPSIDKEKLEKAAEKVFDRLNYFNDYILQTIGERIKATGQLSAHDQTALKNMADISGDMEAITKKLAEVTKQNVGDIEKIYTQTVTEGVNTYKPLFDFKGMEFVPFGQNEFAQQLVRHWFKETAGEMINLSRTKALCFDQYNLAGEMIGSVALDGAYQKAIDDAVIAVSDGTVDFNTAMRKTIEQLGGSGVKVHYGSGVNRSLSSMVRQNLLYGVKQAAQAYDEYVGKVLGCNGFEVDYHAHPRPSHAFMGGEIYAYEGDLTVNGKTYKDGAEALDRLRDYGCLHFKTDVILGVSEPRYDRAWLEKQKAEDERLIEFNGRKKTKYEWQQAQRRIEAAVRRQRDIAHMAEASGDRILAKNAADKINAYRKAYDDLCDTVGLEKHYSRMAAYNPKTIDNLGGSGIIKVKEVETVYSGGIAGALNPNSERAMIHAEKYYSEVRKMNTDCAKIAKNVGWTKESIAKIKEHLFYRKHNLGGTEPEYFDADYDIAITWQNLIDGKNIQEKDIILLKHEYLELYIMKNKKVGYAEAHKLAEEKHNYSAALKEWRDSI